eukprot:2082758-Pyramimonas_sp.AAC.2
MFTFWPSHITHSKRGRGRGLLMQRRSVFGFLIGYGVVWVPLISNNNLVELSTCAWCIEQSETMQQI